MNDLLSIQEKKQIDRRLAIDFWGVGFFVTGLISTYIRPEQPDIGLFFQFFGAVLVAFVISVRGIRGVIFEERNIIEQIVSIACIASLIQQDYFTTIVVPLIIHIGQILEERSFVGIHKALERLQKLMQHECIQLVNGEEQKIPLNEIKVGDQIILYPGMRNPLDGKVFQGQGWIDTSFLTGESQPTQVKIGDEIPSGVMNISSKLWIEVNSKGEESILGNIVHLLQKSEGKAKTESFVFSFFPFYVPCVLVIFAIVLFFTEDIHLSMLLVIALVPSGLILSSSIVMMAMLSRCGQEGILIRDISLFSSILSIDHICFDKTGTLTQDERSVTDIIFFQELDDPLKNIIYAISQQSKHPICSSIQKYGDQHHWCKEAIYLEEVEEVFGCGIQVHYEGRMIRLGRGTWLKSLGVQGSFDERETSAYLGIDSDVYLGFTIEDHIREDAKDVVETLNKTYDVQLLTGDKEDIAQRLELPFSNIYAGLLPQEKAMIIQNMSGKVMMIGDGINDALALQSANVSIAFGGDVGEILIGQADVVIQKKLHQIPFLLDISKLGHLITWQNLMISLFFSIILTGCAIWLQFPAWQLAIGINISAIFVVFNCSRILLFRRNDN